MILHVFVRIEGALLPCLYFAICIVGELGAAGLAPMRPAPAARSHALLVLAGRDLLRERQALEACVKLSKNLGTFGCWIKFVAAILPPKYPLVELLLERDLFFVRGLPEAQRLEEVGSQLVAQNGRMTVVREGISRPLTNIIRPPQLDPPLGGPVEEVNRHGASAPSALVTGENGHGLLPLPCEPWHAAFPHALFPESLGMTFAQADAQEEEAEARRQLPASRLVRFLRWGAQ